MKIHDELEINVIRNFPFYKMLSKPYALFNYTKPFISQAHKNLQIFYLSEFKNEISVYFIKKSPSNFPDRKELFSFLFPIQRIENRREIKRTSTFPPADLHKI